MSYKTLGKSAIIVLAISFGMFACKKEKPADDTRVVERQLNLPATTYDYFNKHRVSSDMSTLGRVLFYDVNLSANNSTSCGSCHKQEFAFANNLRFDRGFNGLELKRNTPSIQGLIGVNTSFNSSGADFTPTPANQREIGLFWDARQTHLGNMVLNPVLNHSEMSLSNFDVLIKKVSSLSYYPPLFQKAFGTNQAITKENIALALQAFVQCLNTENSGFGSTPVSDSLILSLNEQEKIGRFLFHTKYNCAQCHDPGNSGTYSSPGNSFVANSSLFNIGLDAEYADQGRGAITKNPNDDGLFKVPTLRNISLTAPYMHDGRFITLEEVLDHYSDNIKMHRNLSEQFKNSNGTLKTLNISKPEKQAIIAFLRRLTDKDFITSPMYSDPFN